MTMPLSIEQTQAHNGFHFEGNLKIDNEVSIFIGKNGAGKSRFFQCIKSGTAKIELDGSLLEPGSEVTFLTHTELMPQFTTQHDQNGYDAKLINIIKSYNQHKDLLSKPYNPNYDANILMRRTHFQETYSDLHKSMSLISKKTGKNIAELSDEDIMLHYERSPSVSLGNYDIATLFNQYVKKWHINEFNQWRKYKGKNVPSYSDDEFTAKFGPPPWVALNEILKSVFDGKFYFSCPNMESITFDHQTYLLDYSGKSIPTENLSTGEKTLLWLALSLFNTQYHNSDLVPSPKLLLLDEPDAYLHPKMVEKMYAMLQEFHNKFKTWSMFITHSPTTAALAPADSIYAVSPNKIEKIDKDSAIAELLEGVPQISIDPAKRRQVFVESYYDSQIFQELFNYLKNRSKKINPKISLTFVSSGGKVPSEYISQKVKQIFGIKDDEKINEFLLAVNGGGSCSQVYGIVESLNSVGPRFARGLVDWDSKNNHTEDVRVFAKGYAYAIENVFLDPISILFLAHFLDPISYSMIKFCNRDITPKEWMQSEELLQKSLDHYIETIIGKTNSKNSKIMYRSGIEVLTDTEYLQMNGHDLERIIYEKIPKLKTIARPQRDGDLKYAIVTKSMIAASSGDLIPLFIESELAKLQE
jgi:ABC-type branched-subunit amino acid transport system ATPase component